MPCRTLHDFCEIACSSCRASVPAPTIVRSITTLGIALSLGLVPGMRDAGPAARLRPAKGFVLRRMPRRAGRTAARVRDKCPGLEHFQEKWEPVFRPKMRQTREASAP